MASVGSGLAESRVAALLFILVVQAGCGSDNPGANAAGGAAGASTAGGAGTAGSTGTAGSAGGTGGGGAGGSAGSVAGTGGAPAADCSGTPFGAASTVLDEDPTYLVSSPTVTADERELFYARSVAPNDPASTNPSNFRRSTRAGTDVHFPAGSVVAELDAACAVGDNRTIDLSPDGLTAYLVCAPGSGYTTGTLRIAKRASPSAAFVVDPMSYGQTGLSATASADGLTVYTSAESNTTVALLEFSRSGPGDAFGASMRVSGLETQSLSTPDIAPDDLWIYAVAAGSQIVGAQRAFSGAPFGAPVVLLDGVPGTLRYGSPKMAQSCRTLYAIASSLSTPASFSLVQASR